MQFFGGGSSALALTPSPAALPGTATGLAGNNANMLYIFNRNGICLLYREWHRPLRTLDAQQVQKIMFGLLFSLRSFTAKMDLTSVEKDNLGVPLLPGQGCSYHSFQTNTYKLNFMESPSGIKYSKAAGKIKDAISNLPAATVEDDTEEAQVLAKVETAKSDLIKDSVDSISPLSPSELEKQASDPFGLDALLLPAGKKDEKPRGKEVTALNKKAEEEEYKRFIKAQREGLLLCLEIAARRYKVPWCQTTIDILAKHAFDHIDRFTLQQRKAIERLWKQGKSITGKLDMNAFECLQEKYAHEKISIQLSVGGGGERRAQQWLG